MELENPMFTEVLAKRNPHLCGLICWLLVGRGPYTTYDKLGEIDHGAIVDSKRLGAVLQVAQITQANRDSRAASVPSSAHRGNGAHVPRTRRPGTKTQRDLGPFDLKKAIEKRASLAL